MQGFLWTWVMAAGLIFQQSYPHAFPRDGATKVLENERVIIWEVVWKKGVSSGMHQHQYDLAGVYLAEGAIKVTLPDGVVRESQPTKVGQVVFQKKGVIHAEEGIGNIERRAILVDLKDYTPTSLEKKTDIPIAFPREGAKKLLDNERVVIWDYAWDPVKPVPLHYHDKDTAVVFIEAGKLRSTPVGGQEEVNPREFGEVRFNRRDRAHSEGAVGGSPRAVIIELK